MELFFITLFLFVIAIYYLLILYHILHIFRPVFADYYYQLLQENYDDKVLYIELRVSLPKLYDLSGKIYTPKEVIAIIKSVVDRCVLLNSKNIFLIE